MSNRLAQETSPYLLQHAQNPVDWYPWGPEALQRAQAENKPIFLSVGYSACHWCHVMEHESFEDPEIAQLLNQSFISIKVDREERPDLDQIYMNAVQIFQKGRGGWPMSVFLTPDLQPFYGGTYWPPRRNLNMPGFDQVIRAITEAWTNARSQVAETAQEITRRLQLLGEPTDQGGELNEALLLSALPNLERMFDYQYGGFGVAPKFPHAMDLRVLLRIWRRSGAANALEMVTLNLDKMAAGGIYDHLAGGFARYSVDARWLVPHFEKMLYDNALLTAVYIEAYQATGQPRFARTARETLDYVRRYMTDESGGFHSTEDADSEGEEGKFYVWSPAEIQEVLGAEKAERFCQVYDVTEEGNFEGHNILNLPKSIAQFAMLHGLDLESLQQELSAARARLLEVRDRRVRPAKDDKILASWNGLMIEAFARAAVVLGEDEYAQAAARAMDCLLTSLRTAEGRLLHSWRLGQARLPAYLDDYANVTQALVALYEATWNERWIDEAVRLAGDMLAHFADAERGGFYFTANDHEALIARNKDFYDSSVPSGNAMAATALIQLGKLCGRADFLSAAQQALQLAVPLMQQSPVAAGQFLIALDLWLGPTPEIAVLGEGVDTTAALESLQRRFWPTRVVAWRPTAPAAGKPTALEALFQGKSPQTPAPTVYVCEGFACQAPLAGRAAAEAAFTHWAALPDADESPDAV